MAGTPSQVRRPRALGTPGGPTLSFFFCRPSNFHFTGSRAGWVLCCPSDVCSAHAIPPDPCCAQRLVLRRDLVDMLVAHHLA